MQLEVTESYDHNACRKVSDQHGTWLIVKGRALWHHVCHVASLPQLFTLVILFKCIMCRTQLAPLNLELVTAHCCQVMQRPGIQCYTAMLAWCEEKLSLHSHYLATLTALWLEEK
jgi:hypothetical protein